MNSPLRFRALDELTLRQNQIETNKHLIPIRARRIHWTSKPSTNQPLTNPHCNKCPGHICPDCQK